MTSRIIFIALVSFFLSGCLGGERFVDVDLRTTEHWGAVKVFDASERPMDQVEAKVQAKKTLNVLALSGGGADGAFGAGLLTGWTETGTRPSFDVVTGVSTGALQATFAFLGPEYDPVLTDLYTDTRSQEIFTHRGVSGLLGDSLMDTEALATKIASIVTPDLLARVAAEHRKGRRLYVATTNLDAGTVTTWDMGKIAASESPDRGTLYNEILRASAAVPGYFEPVIIHPASGVEGDHGQMHVDGGVKTPVLLRSFMLEGKYAKKNVYIVVNGAMRLKNSRTAVNASLAGIAKKSITELLRGLLYKTVYQSYVVVKQSNAEFHLAYVPDDVNETHDPLEFDPPEMRMLYEAGRREAKSATLWRKEPPRLERAERIAAAR